MRRSWNHLGARGSLDSLQSDKIRRKSHQKNKSSEVAAPLPSLWMLQVETGFHSPCIDARSIASKRSPQFFHVLDKAASPNSSDPGSCSGDIERIVEPEKLLSRKKRTHVVEVRLMFRNAFCEIPKFVLPIFEFGGRFPPLRLVSLRVNLALLAAIKTTFSLSEHRRRGFSTLLTSFGLFF